MSKGEEPTLAQLALLYLSSAHLVIGLLLCLGYLKEADGDFCLLVIGRNDEHVCCSSWEETWKYLCSFLPEFYVLMFVCKEYSYINDLVFIFQKQKLIA